jgi:hypothetical protein
MLGEASLISRSKRGVPLVALIDRYIQINVGRILGKGIEGESALSVSAEN